MNKDHGNQSSDKLLRIIECMAANRLPCRLIDLAEKLDFPQSTVLRYLRTLCSQGYAYHDEQSGCYALTWKICRLCDSVKANLVLRSMASPFLSELANDHNVGALLATLYDGSVLYLDMVGNPHNVMDTMLRIGKSAPIHTTGSGKILLSAMSGREIDNIIKNDGLMRLTENTITSREALLKELDDVRERGYALDNEECETGHRCVSVPLYDYTGGIAAAISAFDSADRMTEQRLRDELLPALFDTASQISFRMGYSQP